MFAVCANLISLNRKVQTEKDSSEIELQLRCHFHLAFKKASRSLFIIRVGVHVLRLEVKKMNKHRQTGRIVLDKTIQSIFVKNPVISASCLTRPDEVVALARP